MRLARVTGHVTLNRRLEEFPKGALLLCDALDPEGVQRIDADRPRRSPMDQSLVVFDELGAGVGSVVAIAEGAEGAMPWWPDRRPVDAYCVAIVDTVHVQPELMST